MFSLVVNDWCWGIGNTKEVTKTYSIQSHDVESETEGMDKRDKRKIEKRTSDLIYFTISQMIKQ
jgi:hypothetical protein